MFFLYRYVFILYLLNIVILCFSETEFDWKLGNTTLHLSSYSYCDANSYLSTEYIGFSTGFQPTYRIYNKLYDVNGFIGYNELDNSIYVVFRGTNSLKDWIDDLQIWMSLYPSCPGGYVHEGFFAAHNSVIQDVLNEVNRLKLIYPTYDIIVTGHSLGGALATLTSVDLSNSNISATLINFGSPRLFDKESASCVSAKISTIYRITYHKDIVVHLPFLRAGFMHITGEWYHDENENIHHCKGYEDENCANKWKTRHDVNDHHKYLNQLINKCPI